MASWNGLARTNYVTPVNLGELETIAERLALRLIRKENKIGFAAETDDRGWPTNIYDEELKDNVAFDIDAEIMPLVREGEVLV